jgi:DNA modification methylase
MIARKLPFTVDPLREAEVQPVTIQEERPETYTGIYAMHKYWSKKPRNLIVNYIERFSKEQDIVLDAFCGSGVTLIESVRHKRRAIGIDINPIAVFMTRMSLTQVDIKELKKCFDSIKSNVSELIDELYYTECLKCRNPKAVATHAVWENGNIKEIWLSCSECKIRKCSKVASEEDLIHIEKFEKPLTWFPTNEITANSRLSVKAGTRICDLFTTRALTGLSLLLERIRQIPNAKIREVMEFCFSAALPQTSKMVFVIRRRGKTQGVGKAEKAEVGSWVIGFWIPSEHFEIHVWRCFENRFKRIIAGKEEVNAVIPSSIMRCRSFEELNQAQQGFWVSVDSSTKLPIPDASIDYVFTDPPHGNRIPYLELSLIWNSWLGWECDWEAEIIVSEAKSRQKNLIDYEDRLATAFAELWRVLKPNKFASIVFNSLDDETWLSFLNTCLGAGFQVSEIKSLEYSARSVVQDNRKNALKTDLVITCQKKKPVATRLIFFDDDHSELEQSISKYIVNRNGAETYQILNYLFARSIPTGKIFKISQVLETLESRYVFNQGQWYLR